MKEPETGLKYRIGEEETVKQIYAYIRVSTKEQHPDRQLAAMQSMNICPKNIYLDMISGKDFSRPAYQRLLRRLHKGDILVIKSIDRLGRDYGEILEQWRILTRDKGVQIRVLDMPLLNTDTFREDLTGVFIADLVLQILAYVAETERAFIRQRQAEGIAVARAKGKQMGRERLTLPDEFPMYQEKWQRGEISTRKAAAALGISHTTFYRRCHEENDRKCNKR